MSVYLTTEKQEEILALNFSCESLSSRQKNSISKLQIATYHQLKVIKSIKDQFMKLRIVIVSLMIKIFSSFEPEHQTQLNRLKEIIYSPSLTRLTEQKGLERDQLLKSAATAISRLKVPLDSEADIIKLFNCTPFFDRVVMNACVQNQPHLLRSDNNDNEISQWVHKNFGLRVVWNNYQTVGEHREELLLLGIKKSAEELGFEEYYRLSFDDLATADDDNETERLTRYKTLVCMQTPKEEVEKKEAENHLIITSIDTASPSLSAFPESGQKYQYALKDNSSYSQVQVFNPVSSKKAKYDPTASSIGHERSSRGVIKVKRCKGDKSSAGSTLWRILCCAISSS